jgi:hypothetical protein
MSIPFTERTTLPGAGALVPPEPELGTEPPPDGDKPGEELPPLDEPPLEGAPADVVVDICCANGSLLANRLNDAS